MLWESQEGKGRDIKMKLKPGRIGAGSSKWDQPGEPKMGLRCNGESREEQPRGLGTRGIESAGRRTDMAAIELKGEAEGFG